MVEHRERSYTLYSKAKTTEIEEEDSKTIFYNNETPQL